MEYARPFCRISCKIPGVAGRVIEVEMPAGGGTRPGLVRTVTSLWHTKLPPKDNRVPTTDKFKGQLENVVIIVSERVKVKI